MSFSVGSVTAKLDAKIQMFQRRMKQAGTSLNEFAKKHEAVSSRIQKANKRLRQSVSNVANDFKNKLGNAINVTKKGLAFLGTGAVALGGLILTAGGQVEKLKTALLTTFQGSQKEAGKAFTQIKNFTKSTPFQLNEVLDGFIKLKNMGLNPSQKALTSYGDTASAMGKSLNQMVEAVADAATGEFERLKEFGIRTSVEGDRVKFTFKGVTKEVGKNSKEIEDYLMKLGQTNFAGGMERQSKTLFGLLSTLKDDIFLTFSDLAETTGLMQGAKDGINILSVNIQKFAKLIESSMPKIEKVASDVEKQFDNITESSLFKNIQNYISDFNNIDGVLAGIAFTVGVLVAGAFASMAIAVLSATWPLLAIAGAFALLFELYQNNTGFRTFIDNTFTYLKDTVLPGLIMAWNTYLLPALTNLYNMVMTQLWPALQNLGISLMNLWNTISPILIPVLQLLAVIIGVVIYGAFLAFIFLLQLAVNVITIVADTITFFINGAVALFNHLKQAWGNFTSFFALSTEEKLNVVSYWFGYIVGSVVKMFENMKTQSIARLELIKAWVVAFPAIVKARFIQIKDDIINQIKTAVENGKKSFDEFSKIDLTQVGKDIITGLINSLKNKAVDLKNTVGDMADSIKNGFTDAMKINSPSKVFEAFGNFIGEGLRIGLNSEQAEVEVAGADLAGATIRGAGNITNNNSFNISGGGNTQAIVSQVIRALARQNNLGKSGVNI